MGARLAISVARGREKFSTRRLALLTAVTLIATISSLGAVQPASASSSVNGDRSQIAQLEARIAAEGATAQRLVSSYDAAVGKEQQIKARLVAIGHSLVADRSAKTRTATKLRKVAIATYVFSGSSAGAGTLLSVPSAESAVASVYANLAAGQLQTAVVSYSIDSHRVAIDQANLQNEQAAVEGVIRVLLPDQNAAEKAIGQDEKLLQSVRGNLQSLLAANQRREAQIERQQEETLARQSVAASTASAVQVPTPTAPATVTAPSGYENPLRAVSGLSSWRIDQGVDYGGFGPIYAIGDGVVISTVNGGWPGGTFITYRLTSGPAAGLVVYDAEDIVPRVVPGESVGPDTELGTMYGGPTGIETGWADGGLGDTMAMVTGQFGGSDSTAFGANFSQLLRSLGAPGGILQNDPPTGAMPSGWPTW